MGAWTQLGVGIARAFGMGELASEVQRLKGELAKANKEIRRLRGEHDRILALYNIATVERNNWHRAWLEDKDGPRIMPGEPRPVPDNPH